MVTDKRLLIIATAITSVLAWTACSEAPKPTAAETKPAAEAPKEPPKPAEPVTAQTAFWEMYKPARTWAPDLLPLSLANKAVPGKKDDEGKASMWTAVFVSPSLREARTFFYSTVDDGASIRRGVTTGGAQPWSGATPQSRPFQTTEFSVNSDAAYKTAMGKAEGWVKKHPGKTPDFFLGSTAKFPQPVWLVIWGTSKAGYAVYINASTGIPVTK